MEISAGTASRSYGQAFKNRRPPRDANSVMAAGSFTVWLTMPTRSGFLFWLTFPFTSQCNGNYDSNTKHISHQYGSDDSSRCRLHRNYDAINSIITQKQLYLTMKTVRTSGTVPGEHMVGQTQLMVQLVVGSRRTASRSGRDLL